MIESRDGKTIAYLMRDFSPASKEEAEMVKVTDQEGKVTFGFPAKSAKESYSPKAPGLDERIRRFREAVKKKRGKYRRKPIVYYARPLQMYGTAMEAGDIEQLRQEFPGHRIRVLRTCEKKRRGMGYYHRKVEESAILAIRPIHKNRLTAGVWSEAKHALKKGIRVVRLKRGAIRTIHEAHLRKVKRGRRNPAGHFGFVKSKAVTQAELRREKEAKLRKLAKKLNRKVNS